MAMEEVLRWDKEPTAVWFSMKDQSEGGSAMQTSFRICQVDKSENRVSKSVCIVSPLAKHSAVHCHKAYKDQREGGQDKNYLGKDGQAGERKVFGERGKSLHANIQLWKDTDYC